MLRIFRGRVVGLAADLTIIASGVELAGLFRDSGLLFGPAGGLAVNPCLQSDEHPEIFGVGACTEFAEQPLTKIGVLAYRQNPVLLANLFGALTGRELIAFKPRSRYTLMFNLGDGTAIYIRGPFSWMGRLAYTAKNRIDRRFMEIHQAAERSLIIPRGSARLPASAR